MFILRSFFTGVMPAVRVILKVTFKQTMIASGVWLASTSAYNTPSLQPLTILLRLGWLGTGFLCCVLLTRVVEHGITAT